MIAAAFRTTVVVVIVAVTTAQPLSQFRYCRNCRQCRWLLVLPQHVHATHMVDMGVSLILVPCSSICTSVNRTASMKMDDTCAITPISTKRTSPAHPGRRGVRGTCEYICERTRCYGMRVCARAGAGMCVCEWQAEVRG